MRILVYRYAIAVPCFILVQLSYAHKSNMHQTVQFLVFRSLFSWDNFTVTSPITNNMVNCSYDFNMVINTKAKSLNDDFIQV